jgi:ABC-type branched-subunit amino acid transport system ATPase component
VVGWKSGAAVTPPEINASAPASLLRVSDLRVTYPNGAVGVDGVSLQVESGTILAVLGRNGAGKTSLLRAIAGFLRSEHVTISGHREFGGQRVTTASPMRMHRLGVVFVPERDKVFPGLKVEEHLRLVGGADGSGSYLSFEAIDRRANSKAGMLSGGERQMLALMMAVRQNPRLLLVDELSLGLAPVIVKELMESLRRFVDQTGVPIVLVDQDASAALRIADRVAVIDRGRIAWEGASGETTAAAVSSQFLGVAH